MSWFKNIFSKGDKAQKAEPQPTAPAPAPEAPKPKPQPRQAPAAHSKPSDGGGGNPAESIEHLDKTIGLLEHKEADLEKKIEVEIAKAKDFMAKSNKSSALACMKRKKMYEEELVRVANQKTTMDQMKFTLMTAALNKEVLEAQRRAGNELTNIHAGMTAEKVEDEMEKVRDAMEQAAEVSRLLGEQLDGGVDDDELMDELEELAAASKPKAKASAGAASASAEAPLDLPKVPTAPIGGKTVAKPTKVSTAEEDEEAAALRELEAQLGA
jgi:charged multivesicular body protein 4